MGVYARRAISLLWVCNSSVQIFRHLNLSMGPNVIRPIRRFRGITVAFDRLASYQGDPPIVSSMELAAAAGLDESEDARWEPISAIEPTSMMPTGA